MSKIIISQSYKDQLAAARVNGLSRTPLWNSIRSAYGIPSSIKLAMTCARELYVKGTDPKQFLHEYKGAFVSAMADMSAPVATSGIEMSRFVVATTRDDLPQSDWSRVSVEDVLYTMRDSDNVEDGATLPEGFPKGAGRDALIVDSATGDVYFRT
jgi:hypothetical protein